MNGCALSKLVKEGWEMPRGWISVVGGQNQTRKAIEVFLIRGSRSGLLFELTITTKR